MTANKISVKIKDQNAAMQQLLSFSEHFETCSIYDSNELPAPLDYGRFEILAGFGCKERVEGNFTELTSKAEMSGEWIFCYLTYEAHLKLNNEMVNMDEDAFFYKPEIVCMLEKNSDTLSIINNGIASERFIDCTNILLSGNNNTLPGLSEEIAFEPKTEKGTYISNIDKIKENIIEGDYYEINYCQKFEHNGQLKHAVSTFNAINKKSPTPFAAFVKNNRFTLLCTSPERFIFREDDHIVSQPIKGTNKKLPGNANSTQLTMLKNSEKENAENVMIVDLVRNDLAKICKNGTIRVEELFGTYPFALVNQMISTISGQLKENVTLAEIFRATFPMGSMTGAPKTEVMKNIAVYENSKRGLYSGCIGYIMPGGNFDFNVIIRTIVEDKRNGKISYHVGGAITYDSIPDNEYEECLLKAKGLTELNRNK